MKAHQEALSSVETMENVFAMINKLREDNSDDTVVFKFSLPPTNHAKGVIQYFLRGFYNEADLPGKFVELFSKAPKTQRLTPNGFAPLTDVKPEPKMTYLNLPVNRKVAFGYGSYLDHLYQQQHAEALASLDLKVVAVQLPKMSKNRVPVGHVFVVQGTSGAKIMPPIDADVDITVHLPYTLSKTAEADIPLDEQQGRAFLHVRAVLITEVRELKNSLPC
jgi:hypothetical protein